MSTHRFKLEPLQRKVTLFWSWWQALEKNREVYFKKSIFGHQELFTWLVGESLLHFKAAIF